MRLFNGVIDMRYRCVTSLAILFLVLLCGACGGGGGGGGFGGNFKLYTAIASGDLNGDSRPDLAVSSFASSDSTDPMTVLLQSPAADGVFESGADYMWWEHHPSRWRSAI